MTAVTEARKLSGKVGQIGGVVADTSALTIKYPKIDDRATPVKYFPPRKTWYKKAILHAQPDTDAGVRRRAIKYSYRGGYFKLRIIMK